MHSSFPVVLAAIGCLAMGARAAEHRVRPPVRGVPDFQGIWTNDALTSLERDDEFKALDIAEDQAHAYEALWNDPVRLKAELERKHPPKGPDVGGFETEAPFSTWDDRLARIDGRARSSWIVDPADGKLPWSEAGKARREAWLKQARTWAAPEVRSAGERCIVGPGAPLGPPLMNNGLGLFQIVQTPDAVVITTEASYDTRIVRLNSPHLPAQIRPWHGDSVGWWDGEELVVETTNFNPGETVRLVSNSVVLISPAARVTERFRRVSPARFLYSFTVDDPATYSRPWRGEMPFDATSKRMFEYACHEGDYSFGNTLAGYRRTEADLAELEAALGARLSRDAAGR